MLFFLATLSREREVSHQKSVRLYGDQANRLRAGRCITKDEVWNGLSPGRFSDAELSDHLQTLLTFGSGFVTESGGIDRLHLEFKVMRDLAQYLAIEKVCRSECVAVFPT